MKSLAIISSIITFFLAVNISYAKEIYVPENFTDIQLAINNATQGDILFVSGTFNLNSSIIVNVSNLTIIGNNATIIGGGSNWTNLQCQGFYRQDEPNYHQGDVFKIYADNVVINNFTVRNSGIADSDSLFYFPNVTNLTLSNLILLDSCNALEGANANIQNVSFNITSSNPSFQGAKIIKNLFNSTIVNLFDYSRIYGYGGLSPSPGALIVNLQNSTLNNFTSNWTAIINSTGNNFTNLKSNSLILRNQINNKFSGEIANAISIWRSEDFSWTDLTFKTVIPSILINNRLSDYFYISANFIINENNTITLGLFYNRTLYNELNATYFLINNRSLPINMSRFDGNRWVAIPTFCNYDNAYCESNVTQLSVWTLSAGEPQYQQQSQTQQSQSSGGSSGGSNPGGGSLNSGYYIPISSANKTNPPNIIIQYEYLDCSKIILPEGSKCNETYVFIPEKIKEIEKQILMKQPYIPSQLFLLIPFIILVGLAGYWLGMKRGEKI